jgi:hypothetical protein
MEHHYLGIVEAVSNEVATGNIGPATEGASYCLSGGGQTSTQRQDSSFTVGRRDQTRDTNPRAGRYGS